MDTCVIRGKECTGKTCSGSCRAKLSRRTRTVENDAHAPQAHAPIDAGNPAVLQDIIAGNNNPNTTRSIVLSDGQTFYPDPRPGQVLDQWMTGAHGAYKQVLAGLAQSRKRIYA